MKYLLDTCVVSDFIKGEVGTLKQLKRISPSMVTISSITSMEIDYGLALNPQRAARIKPVLNDFLQTITILNFTQHDAFHAATIREQLKQQGCLIGSYDVLLAGTALSRNLILVSANVNEFKRVDRLQLENWRQ